MGWLSGKKSKQNGEANGLTAAETGLVQIVPTGSDYAKVQDKKEAHLPVAVAIFDDSATSKRDNSGTYRPPTPSAPVASPAPTTPSHYLSTPPTNATAVTRTTTTVTTTQLNHGPAPPPSKGLFGFKNTASVAPIPNPMLTPHTVISSSTTGKSPLALRTGPGGAVKTAPVILGRMPTNLPVCPYCCHINVRTRIMTVPNWLTWVSVIVVLFVFWPLFWAPLLIDACKRTDHYCSQCQALVATIPPYKDCCVKSRA
jgi:LITAF-like zinc ribbon domain